LLTIEDNNTIASAKSSSNEKNRHMKNPVPKDISEAFEEKDNYHKFIFNSMVDMVKKV